MKPACEGFDTLALARSLLNPLRGFDTLALARSLLNPLNRGLAHRPSGCPITS